MNIERGDEFRGGHAAEPDPSAKSPCPACETGGSALKPITLRTLLKEHLRAEVRDEVYRFCANPRCEVVHYSQDGLQWFTRDDLTVRVGLKETESPRPLCYCFDHSFESLQDEWASTGRITAIDSIKAELKAGTCSCEFTNPRGSCCLGDVLKAAKEIKGMSHVQESAHEQDAAMSNSHDCCAPTPSISAPEETCCAMPSKPNSSEAGAVDTAGEARTIWGAIGLGVLASACCWLPLALAGLGVAGGAAGATVAWIRPWALGGLGLLLMGVIGWWARKRTVSSRTPAACCVVVPFPTLAVAVLAASSVLAWAAPRIFHPGRGTSVLASAPAAPAGSTLLVLSTPQFDCPPCAGTLPQVLAKTPGVSSVEMDFEVRQTRVTFLAGADMNGILGEWKRVHGFEGVEVRRQRL